MLGAAVYALGGAVYVPFIRAEPQPWNDLASREAAAGRKLRKEDDNMEDQF